ncbi:hypothetical protein LIA77_02642 [Sarocladium implicatum]|nr:hypothetical protein LIA77_02642 [Sarocladium implicatum]
MSRQKYQMRSDSDCRLAGQVVSSDSRFSRSLRDDVPSSGEVSSGQKTMLTTPSAAVRPLRAPGADASICLDTIVPTHAVQGTPSAWPMTPPSNARRGYVILAMNRILSSHVRSTHEISSLAAIVVIPSCNAVSGCIERSTAFKPILLLRSDY